MDEHAIVFFGIQCLVHQFNTFKVFSQKNKKLLTDVVEHGKLSLVVIKQQLINATTLKT